MKKFAILGLCMLMTAGAQQKPAQAPPMSPEMQKEMEARARAVEPGPQHARLMTLVGDFTTHSKFFLAAGAPAQESDGTAKLKAALGGRFLLEETTGTIMGQPVSGMRMYGFNNGTKKYEGVWAYTGSTSVMTLSGASKDAGKTVQFQGTYADDLSGQAQMLQITLTEIDADHFRVELAGTNPDGSPGARLEELYTRKK